jgi:hypothetical protein
MILWRKRAETIAFAALALGLGVARLGAVDQRLA